ncbi:hypothetical protein MPLB_2410064 [Mesorhizobium sp. ORS 3324]|nr:hypothetical protein MPLB_2410064 [Mesorhizobium sp. ORS 3324]
MEDGVDRSVLPSDLRQAPMRRLHQLELVTVFYVPEEPEIYVASQACDCTFMGARRGRRLDPSCKAPP